MNAVNVPAVVGVLVVVVLCLTVVGFVESFVRRARLRRRRGAYLSAAYGRKLEVRGYAEALRARGVEVSSTWHDDDGEDVDPASPEATLVAVLDLEEVRRSAVFVAFTEGGLTRGGHHAELGAALALGVPAVVVGPVEQHFHSHPGVRTSFRLGRIGCCSRTRIGVSELVYLVKSATDFTGGGG